MCFSVKSLLVSEEAANAVFTARSTALLKAPQTSEAETLWKSHIIDRNIRVVL